MKKKTIQKIKNTIKELENVGIKYKLAHSFVYHVWINEKRKCNLYATTQTWKSFDNKTKDVGIESLMDYLSTGI